MIDKTTWALISGNIHERLHEIQDNSLRDLVSAEIQNAKDAITVADARKSADRCYTLLNTDFGVGAIHDSVLVRTIDEVEVTVDVVAPRDAVQRPVFLYIHGGAFISGCARYYRNVAFRLAETGFTVFNVNYRLSPEHQFPAGFEDCEASLLWVAEHAHEYGGDCSRITIGGDSAGANLAAAVAAVSAANSNFPKISAAVLFYGMYDNRALLSGDYSVSWARVLRYYLGPRVSKLLDDPRISPLSLASSMPPSYIAVGSEDLMYIQESMNLSAELDKASVPNLLRILEGFPHGFLSHESIYPEIRSVLQQVSDFSSQYC